MPNAQAQRRQRAIDRYLAGDPIEDICRELACSKSWLYKWRDRYGSLLERRAEPKPQNQPDQNAPMHRTGRRGLAPYAGPAWQRLWCRFHQAGTRTARDRACTFTAHDLADSPLLCTGGDINHPPSSIRPSAGKFSPSFDRPYRQGNMAA
jgi:Homeodomain-like domain